MALGRLDPNVWTEEVARDYDRSSAAMYAPEVLGPTVNFLAKIAAGGPVLEFAIGTGRVALPLAERGLSVTGIESSQPMIDELRRKPGADRIPVAHGDMASTRVEGGFALVYLVFNGITNLLSQEHQVQCFRNAAQHLRTGGALVIEVFVPDLRRLVPGDTVRPFGVSDEHLGIDEYDTVAQLMVSHHYRFAGGRASTFSSPHRYVWPSELDLMARLAGLTLVERWADWDRSPFTADSGSHVSVWRSSA
jgi:SAM-dependent methyltransferase